ncbi:MAG: site-specific DNA-methyltransferase, partial [bacterium]
EQNAVDEVKRNFILVQLPECLSTDNTDQKSAAQYCASNGFEANIAELTKERLRRAAVQVKLEHSSTTSDLGFRVFALAHSNLRPWSPQANDLPNTLFEHQDHVLEGRSESDVLYELLLKLGIDLCVGIERRTVQDKEVHSVGGGVLMACLTTSIAAAEVEAVAMGIVNWHKELAPAGDTTCVFRDSAFADDVAKTNMASILEQNGIQNVRSL